MGEKGDSQIMLDSDEKVRDGNWYKDEVDSFYPIRRETVRWDMIMPITKHATVHTAK